MARFCGERRNARRRHLLGSTHIIMASFEIFCRNAPGKKYWVFWDSGGLDRVGDWVGCGWSRGDWEVRRLLGGRGGCRGDGGAVRGAPRRGGCWLSRRWLGCGSLCWWLPLWLLLGVTLLTSSGRFWAMFRCGWAFSRGVALLAPWWLWRSAGGRDLRRLFESSHKKRARISGPCELVL